MNSLIGNRIGSGGCSEVFEWEDDKVIKLFRSNTNEYAISKEYKNSVAAWKSGLPTYKPYEKVEVDGRLGIIFERVYGDTIMDRFLNQSADISLPLTDEAMRRLDYEDNDIRITAQTLFEIHKKSIPEMPKQAEMMKESISRASYLTQEEKQRISELVDHLPSKNCLCHGDPNPGNFFMNAGKPVIIDWMNATTGNPASDIAEYIIMIKYSVLPPEVPDRFVTFLDAVRELTIKIFLDEYTKLSGMKYEEIDPWMLPMIAGKLSTDAISDKEKNILVEVVRKKLKEIS